MSRPEQATPQRRGFEWAAALGALVSAPVFVWMIMSGHLSLLQRTSQGDFFDAQAHALLAGHWDVPRDTLGFEAFIVHGKAYMYFGPWPAVLRMPIALFTHRFDGRLTQLSMILAFVTLMIASAKLLWRMRLLARGDAPVTRTEQVAVALLFFLLGAGSIVVFLGAEPVVFHEAELWGAAWSIAALAAVLWLAQEPSRRAVVWAGVFTTFAMTTRASVALAPLAALGIVFVVRACEAVSRRANAKSLGAPSRWLGLGPARSAALDVGGVFVALFVPIALYVYVNEARFGSFFKIPINNQVMTLVDPVRTRVYASTNGNMLAAKFLPTNLSAFLRLDAIRFTGVFPYVTFGPLARPVGNVTFATIGPSASLVTSMLVFVAFGLVGLYAIVRRAALRPLLPLVVGGVVATGGALTIPDIDQRYIGDFLPLLFVLGGIGVFLLVGALERSRPSVRTVVGVVSVAAVLGSAWVNVGLALAYQRAYGPFTSEQDRAAFVRFQHDAPGGSHMPVVRGNELPQKALAGGTLFVIGDCDGVYWTNGIDWHPIERTNATGQFDLAITVPERSDETTETIATAGPADDLTHYAIRYGPGNTATFVVTAPGLAQPATSTPVTLDANHTAHVRMLYDPRSSQSGFFNGETMLAGSVFPIPAGPVTIAGHDNGPSLDFSGSVVVGPKRTPFCSSLRGH